MSKNAMLRKLFRVKREVAPVPRTAAEIEAWLANHIAIALEMAPSDVVPCEEFTSYGLDSRTAVSLAGELETWLDREVPPTLVWDYPTIRAAATFLAPPDEAEAAVLVQHDAGE
jgi:acyl carrier protein